MDYNGIWEDCINKLEDLGFDIDNLSDDILPKLPLSTDSIVGPIIIDAMRDVTMDSGGYHQIERMEGILDGGSVMSIEYAADDYLQFAIQRGYEFRRSQYNCGRYQSSGNDETFRMLTAISFIMDELQMDRMLFYRRSHAKQSILSPNRNIPALQLRVRYFVQNSFLSEQTKELAAMVDSPAETHNEAVKNVMDFCQVYNINTHLSLEVQSSPFGAIRVY